MGGFADFFNFQELLIELLNPQNWAIILSLVIMEGLLSADNALVLGAFVKRFIPNDKALQKKALLYGIFGAYFFRFVAIGLGLWLVNIWWVKVLGGAYLGYMAFDFFKEKLSKKETDDNSEKTESDESEIKIDKKPLMIRLFGTFWGTVAMIEFMDIAFSVDSVLAAFGISDKTWVLFLGGILGILMMRVAAQFFLKLLEKVPELEGGAFALIAIIGIKMVSTTIAEHFMNFKFSHNVETMIMFGSIIIVFGITYLIHLKNKKKNIINN